MRGAKKFMIYGTLLSFAMGLLALCLLRNPIIALLNVPEVSTAQMVSKLLLIYAFAVPFYILPYIAIVGVFRAGGDTKVGLVYDIINVWLIGVTCGFCDWYDTALAVRSCFHCYVDRTHNKVYNVHKVFQIAQMDTPRDECGSSGRIRGRLNGKHKACW